MRFAAGVSPEAGVHAALDDVLRQADGVPDPDLALVFTSGAHNLQLAVVAEELRSSFGRATVLGAAGAGVIGRGREIEGETGLSLLLARLPGVSRHPFVLPPDESPGPRSAGPTSARSGGSWSSRIPTRSTSLPSSPRCTARCPGCPWSAGWGAPRPT